MIESSFRTDDVPATGRFELFRELVAKAHAPADLTSDHEPAFRAGMRLIQIGAVTVWPSFMQPVDFKRGPKRIRQSDPETYHLTLLLRGSKALSQGGQEAIIRPYELQLASSSQPFHVKGTNTDRKLVKVVGLEVPRTLLPLPVDKVCRMVTHRISGREGLGALLAGALTRLARDTGSYRPSDGPRLETVLVDLLSATLAHRLESEGRLSPETRGHTLVLQVRAFIQKHLHDRDLTPPSIAAAHHVSVSRLHRLFQSEGTTVAALIRRQRLERARLDLADPALAHLPIHAIAARCGFSHHAAFTRAFTAAHGAPPTEYRAALTRPRDASHGA